MKNIFYQFLILSLLMSFKVIGQKKKDTIFLLKEKIESDIHKIFIEPNKNSINYKNITDFIEFPKTKRENQLNNIGLIEKWLPLYLYKNKYYVYFPSDFSNNNLIQLSKKEIIFNGFELYNYKIISKIKLVKKNYFKFIYSKPDIKENIITEINILDEKKGIAVFKFTNSKNEISYKLMADVNKVKQFPLIVNYCRFNKTNEFEFEKINFIKLMNR